MSSSFLDSCGLLRRSTIANRTKQRNFHTQQRVVVAGYKQDQFTKRLVKDAKNLDNPR